MQNEPDHRDHRHDHGQETPFEMPLRVWEMESLHLFVDEGLLYPANLDSIIEIYEHKVGPHNGAQVVARAWTNPAYIERLLRDTTAAIAQMGYGGRQGEHMIVVENTPPVHNIVVCTLCCCYPRPVLGLPPVWY